MTKSVSKEIGATNILYAVFLCLLPFVYTEQIVDPVLIPRQIFTSIFLAIIILFIAAQEFKNKQKFETGFLKLYLSIATVLFLLVNFASVFSAVNSAESIYKVSKLFIEVSFFVATTLLIVNKKLDVIFLAKSIVIFSLIVIISVMWQVFTAILNHVEIFKDPQFITSFFANKNLLASILFLTIPFVLMTAIYEKKWKYFALIICALELAIILLIQTKAVILAIFISSAILVVVLLLSKNIKKSRIPVKTIFVIIIAFLFLVSAFFIKTKYNETNKSGAQQNQTNTYVSFPFLTSTNSSFSRVLLWENSINMIKENPLIGVGAGNWQIYFPKYGLNKFENITANGLLTYQRPHNDFLWVFCETGIFGILFYVSIFVFAIFYLIKLIRKQETFLLKWKYYALLFGVMGYVIIALVDFPFERVEHQIFLMLIFSIIAADYFKEFKQNKINSGISFVLIFAILSFSVIMSIVVSVNRFAGEKNTHQLYISHYNSNWGKLINDADLSMNAYYNMDPMSTPIDWYKGVALFTTGNINQAKTCFENAYKLHPYNIHVINNLASCYEKLLMHDKAAEYYKKALEISENFEETILNLSAVYFNSKNFEMAFTTISKCNTNSNDPKYNVFLPAILRAKIGMIIEKQNDEKIKSKLHNFSLKTDSLVYLFKMSLTEKKDFNQYILSK